MQITKAKYSTSKRRMRRAFALATFLGAILLVTLIVASGNGRGKMMGKSKIEQSIQDDERDYKFKIFVYELPEWANVLILKKHEYCRKSAFGTEIVIHENLMRNAHGIRTMNPEEADFFYVPIYAACLVYKDFGLFDEYRFVIRKALDFVMDQPYWHRSLGSDHIWPLVHDFGGCLSWLDNTERIYYKELRNSIFLSHLGDLSMGCFQTHKDIVIPPLVSDDSIRDIVRGARGGEGPRKGEHEKYLVHFRGTVHWYHYEAIPDLMIKSGISETYSRGIRQYILETFEHEADALIVEGPSKNYVQEVLDSTFCLCPRGFAPWSRRFFDAVMLGCIPVIIADYIELPFQEFIDYRAFTIKIADADVGDLMSILRSVPKEAIRQKQRALGAAARYFAYEDRANWRGGGDAFDLILWKLWRKVLPMRPLGGLAWT